MIWLSCLMVIGQYFLCETLLESLCFMKTNATLLINQFFFWLILIFLLKQVYVLFSRSPYTLSLRCAEVFLVVASLYTDVVLFFFSFFSKTSTSARERACENPLRWRSINPLRQEPIPACGLYFITRARQTLKRKYRVCEQARSSLLSPPKKNDIILRRERSDHRKYVCCSQATIHQEPSYTPNDERKHFCALY